MDKKKEEISLHTKEVEQMHRKIPSERRTISEKSDRGDELQFSRGRKAVASDADA